MLHVETDHDGNQVFVYMDSKGIAQLRAILDAFEGQPESPEHDHLMTPSWGGSELDATIDPAKRDSDHGGNRTVHHVKLYYWPTGK